MFLSRSKIGSHPLHLLLPALLLGGFVTFTASAQSSKKHQAPPPKATATPTPVPSATPTPSATAYVLPEVVAKVDGDPISKQDLQRATETLLQSNGRALKDLSPADQRRAYQSVVEDMVIDRIITRKSADEKVPDLDVETQYNTLRSQYPNPDAFDAELKKNGQTPEQVRRNIRLQLAQKQWIAQQIADQINVTPAEVEKFYKEGPPSKFDLPEQVRASQILVRVRKDAPPEDALAAEQKINALADRLKKGESFDAVAKDASEDPSTKTRGGDVGYFSRTQIMPEFADAAFNLKVGQVSAPVRTQFGFHLIKVTDHQPAKNASLSDAKEQITGYLQQEKRKEAVAALVKRLREDAQVEIFIP